MPRANKTANGPGHLTTGSVLNDLGLTPEEVIEAKIKIDLWRDLVAHIKPLHLTQTELADRLNIHQPDVSNLLAGKLSKFSVDTLIRFAIKLGLGFKAKFSHAKPKNGVVGTSHRPSKPAQHSRVLSGIRS